MDLDARLARLRAALERIQDDTGRELDALGPRGLYEAAARIGRRAEARRRAPETRERLEALARRAEAEADRRIR